MANKKIKAFRKKIKIWIILTVVIIALIGIKIAYFSNITPKSQAPTTNVPEASHAFNFGDQKMVVNNQELKFVNDSYKTSDEVYGQHTASISDQTTNSSRTKSAAIVIDNPGGTGTFYYIVGASIKNGREVYSEPVLLGDRIKIVSVSVSEAGAEDSGIITVKYLDRPSGVPMVAEPTQEKTVQYAFENDGNLILVLQ